MKFKLLSSAIGLLFTSVVAAETTQDTRTQSTAIGLAVVNSSSTISLSGLTTPEFDSNGFALSFGFDNPVNPSFSLGYDIELVGFGETTYDSATNWDGSALNFNIKPKLYFGGSDAYIAGILGVSLVGVSFHSGSDSATDNGTGFNLGAEAGYEFPNGLVLSLGIRNTAVEIDGVEFDYSSTFIGGKYKF